MNDFLYEACAPIGLLVMIVLFLWVSFLTYSIIRDKVRKRLSFLKQHRRPKFTYRQWEDDLTGATDYEIWCKWGKHDWEKLRDKDGKRIAFGDLGIAHHLVYILNNLPCCTSGYRSMLRPSKVDNNEANN